MATMTPPRPPLDRDFDVCCRCANIMYEGVPMYLLTICVACWEEVVTRPQQPSSCCVHQHQQQAICGHCCHSNGHEFREPRGPVRCSSPTLDYRLGKPHMRLASPEIPIIKSPTTVSKKGKHVGRPVGSKNKEKKKVKLASQKSTPEPAQSSQTDASSSLPSDAQQSSSGQKLLDPPDSSSKKEKVSHTSTVTSQGSSAPSQPLTAPNTSIQNQETTNQKENQETFTQASTDNNIPNGKAALLPQDSSDHISGTQIAPSTVDAAVTDEKRSETDPTSHGGFESGKSEFQRKDQQSHKPSNDEEEEDMLVTVKQELPEPDPFSVLSDAASDMDVDEEKSDTEVDEEEEKEGYMRHFFCYFCVDDVDLENGKIGKCEFCRPVWSSDKLCTYNEDELSNELRGFIPDYKEGRCIICFQLVSDAGHLCKMCETNIDKALY